MENYSKGKNVEESLEREKIPIPNLPADFLWMQVRGGSKIRNLLSHALTEFPQVNSIVWTGFGTSVGKAISCAEIMKRECGGNLHQITKICYRLVEEYWDPKIPELDQLIVNRKLPMIHILLSKDPLDAEELGYQGPGSIVTIESSEENNSTKQKQRPLQQTRTPTREFAALGMESKKRSRKFGQKKNFENKNTKSPNQQDQQQSSSTQQSEGVQE